MGFWINKNAYLRDAWNWLDFFVVIISVVDWLPVGGGDNASLKSLRTFRILRPLRSINAMPRMRALIQSLLKSLPGLINVIAFLMFAFAIFAIFGVHQFKGALYSRCRVTDQPMPDLDFAFNSAPPGMQPAITGWPYYDEPERLCGSNSQCASWYL